MPSVPTGVQVSLERLQTLLTRGNHAQARRVLDGLAEQVGPDPGLLQHLAQWYMQLNVPAAAERFYARAMALEPGNTGYRYNHASALMALGRMHEAEAQLDRVIAEAPDDWDAWYNRATLRRQTPQHNHVGAIQQALRDPRVDRAASVPLNYALARELEDLGEHAASFAALARGADARRALLTYRVGDDAAIMQALAGAFSERGADDSRAGSDDDRPVFVVGLPRSGTTLVDRILSSHSRIGSHGEGQDFALSLMRLAGPCADKNALLRRSLEMDPAALGQAYMTRIDHVPGARIVDKTPDNFLYLGLIARALPKARIVYVRRTPMDVCYAIYKTLFRTAYPYSYDLSDIAQYWLAFDRLMRHWQDTLPAGRMHIVDYETLVAAPEDTARNLLAHVGMPWEAGCLDFQHNPAPTLTASAAQVRQAIYTSSVDLWKHYRSRLAPLARQLQEAGVTIDDGKQAP